ncbi:MAG: tetratricopeptide repeat protein [Nitrospirota bacterium]
MKKALFIIMCFALFASTNTIFAAEMDNEYDKALKYYNSGKYQEAVELFKEYVKKNPHPDAYYRIGYALYELGKFDEANKYFKDAYLIDPAYSPEWVSPVQGYPEKPSVEEAPSEQPPLIQTGVETQPEPKQESVSEKQPQIEIPEATPVTPEKELSQPES